MIGLFNLSVSALMLLSDVQLIWPIDTLFHKKGILFRASSIVQTTLGHGFIPFCTPMEPQVLPSFPFFLSFVSKYSVSISMRDWTIAISKKRIMINHLLFYLVPKRLCESVNAHMNNFTLFRRTIKLPFLTQLKVCLMLYF